MPRKPNIGGDHYNDPFPTRLRELMESQGIRQEGLTEVLGVKSRQSVTGYTDGSTVPTSDKIIALAKYFHVSADYLLGLENAPTTDIDEKAVLRYTGLSQKALHSIVEAKNRDYLDTVEIFITNKSLIDSGKDLKKAVYRAAAKCEETEIAGSSIFKDGYKEELSEMKDMIDLGLYRVRQSSERAMMDYYPIVKTKDEIQRYLDS